MRETWRGTNVKIKERDSYYCNLKLFLIYLVICGHTIEGLIDSSAVAAQTYQVIYSVHMPLFLFLSGLFLKDGTSCLRQMKQMFLYYGVIQGVTVLAGRAAGLSLSLGIPVWHLWYLLSFGCMAGLGWCWYGLVGRFPLSKVGTNTLWTYLLHAPLIKLLEHLRLSKQVRILISPFVAVFILLFLYKLFQWRNPLCALPASGQKNSTRGKTNKTIQVAGWKR